MKKLNMNDDVYVKLNEIGLNELKKQHEQLRKDFPKYTGKFIEPKKDKNGYSKFQLWHLINELGHLCCIGFNPPFETDILIDEDKLREF